MSLPEELAKRAAEELRYITKVMRDLDGPAWPGSDLELTNTEPDPPFFWKLADGRRVYTDRGIVVELPADKGDARVVNPEKGTVKLVPMERWRGLDAHLN